MLSQVLQNYPQLPAVPLPAGATMFDESLQNSSWLCNQLALQDYVLMCCKLPSGGFRDKPER